MRWLLPVAAVVALVVPTPVLAQAPTVRAEGSDRVHVFTERRNESSRAGRASAGSARRPAATPARSPLPPPPSPSTVVAGRLDLVDGQRCVRIIDVPGDPDSPQALELELLALQYYRDHGPCPGTDVPPAILTPSPGAVAHQLWRDQVQLPTPTLAIPPGRAIVGKPAYLTIHGPHHQRWHFDALGYAIDLAATSTYTIDWGDGTTHTDITTQGGPWPDGDLRHTYQHAGHYHVTVTQHWTATWTAASADGTTSGTIDGVLTTTGTLTNFPVQQIQAVRNR
jgi:hypothetical protein